MTSVLYEASFKFSIFYLIPIVMILIFLIIIKRNYVGKGISFGKIFSIFALVFVVILSIVVFVFQADIYNKTVGEFKKGNYEIVEGYVENFQPMPFEGHSDESFDINGVSFFYSDYSIQPGYNNAKSHGGVITGDGQHLKIGYVYYDDIYGNIIVYIEELP